MKSEAYTYKDAVADVTLTFAFAIGEKNWYQKVAFIQLLKKATEDLTKEVDNSPTETKTGVQ